MKDIDKNNRVYFGLGTIGRDMFYSFEANTLLYFLSDVLSLPVWVFAAASMVSMIKPSFAWFFWVSHQAFQPTAVPPHRERPVL